jgi:hypothetical protein
MEDIAFGLKEYSFHPEKIQLKFILVSVQLAT